MNRTFHMGLVALLVLGCTSDRWRAKTLESVSNESSKVFQVNNFLAGENLKVAKFRLSNGLKVVVLEDHSAPVFAYHTWFDVGSRNEREGITGIAHLFEHLMFKETKNQKEGSFDRILEEQGGRINAATFVDWTYYRESVPSEAFSLVPPLEADRMQNMILNDKQVNSEREVVANERRFRTDNNPSGKMYELLYKTAFTKHPYYWPVIGWMRDIEAISTKDCLEFHKTYYAPNNATVVIVGDVNTEDALKAVNDAYGKIPSSTIPPEKIPAEPMQPKERRKTLKLQVPADKMLIGYHAVDSQHADFPALQVVQSVLFDGKSSRLYRKLVTDTQLASRANGWIYSTKDPGLLVMDVTMRPEKKAAQAEKLIYEELEKMGKELVTKVELEKAINRLETSFWKSFRTVDDKAKGLGFYEVVGNDYRRLFDEVPSVRRVTANEVQQAAKKYFDPNHRTVILAEPEKKS